MDFREKINLSSGPFYFRRENSKFQSTITTTIFYKLFSKQRWMWQGPRTWTSEAAEVIAVLVCDVKFTLGCSLSRLWGPWPLAHSPSFRKNKIVSILLWFVCSMLCILLKTKYILLPDEFNFSMNWIIIIKIFFYEFES